ncbi:hypothetical protein ACHAPD_004638 [Fusarium lateritium]
MAGVIQLGDAIKFAEFAWTVWEYGWARENNAELENAVRRAQESLRSHGARARDSLGGDQYSLLEVIGDYNATLMECDQLLRDNRRYAETTGPIKNIDWNINIMPQVEHLRGRIQMHSTRIQHVLKPFQMDEILAFWPEDEPRTVVAPKEPLVEHISLFQGPLATLSPNISRREIKLQRQLGSNYRFKIVETIESNCQPPIEDPKDLDFDIRSTVLIPLYADPLGCSTATRPPEIMIEVDENKTQRHYRFLFLQDLLAFQAILTGFKVVDGYMEPRAIVRFIMSGDYGDELGDLHDATIQIWIPKEWTDADRSAEDTPANDQGGRASGYGLSTPSLVQKSWDRNGSNILPNRCGTISNPNLRTSPPLVRKSWDWTGQNLLPERWETVSPPDVRTSPPANGSSNTVNSPTMSPMTTTDQFRQPERQNRSNSISSYLSIATNSSGASHSSQGSKHNVPVKLGDGSVGTGYGTVRNPPRNPLLVLFTRPKGPESRRSIVAITLHTKTMPNRTTCKCEQTTECKITALQNAHSLVDAHKFEGDKWDLLRLVASRHDMPRRWDKLIRVSIMFPAPLLRMKFGGGPWAPGSLGGGEGLPQEAADTISQ